MATRAPDAVDIAEAIFALAPSGLFDAQWYRATYRESVPRSCDPLVDFCNGGWREMRRPTYHFDTAWYLEQNAEAADSGINPLLHYMRIGERQNCCPARHFDVAWFRQKYGLEYDQSCLAHHLSSRRLGLTSPNSWFDGAWYVGQYANVLDEADPFEHYERVGSREERCAPVVRRHILASGLFDADHYRARYGIEGDELQLIEHFCGYGWKQNFSPSRFFDTGFYLNRNADVCSSGVNPLLHYITDGAREHRAVSGVFDAEAYLSVHGRNSSGRPFGDGLPLAGCLKADRRKRRLSDRMKSQQPAQVDGELASSQVIDILAASGLFDENFYLLSYPDVRSNGVAPLEHFCRYGEREGRRPNPYFDPGWYRSSLPVTDTEIGNTLLHYVLLGEQAGDRPIPYFDPPWYQMRYEISACVSPLAHYLRNRRRRVLSPTPLFDVEEYARLYGASIGRNRDLFAHYLRAGISDDIDPGPLFDAKSYRTQSMKTERTPFGCLPGAEIIEKIRREALNPLVHSLMHATR